MDLRKIQRKAARTKIRICSSAENSSLRTASSSLGSKSISPYVISNNSRWIDMVHGAEVLMHYLKCYQDYGDIIKEAISKTRNIDQTTSAHTLVTALQKMYKNLLNQNDGVLDKSSPDFAQLKGFLI